MATVVEGDFEWDSDKAASNLTKHGVSFSEAATVFADPFAVYLDDGSGKGRMVVIGTSLRERVLFVVHVERGERDRIISARRATPGEREVYEMSQATKRRVESEMEPVRVLGRGLRAQRGVHLTMRTLREAAGKTQVDVAEASRIDQADISRLENREDFDDCQVSTLQRYLAALGGRLELVAVFGDKKIVLTGSQAGTSGRSPASKALRRATHR